MADSLYPPYAAIPLPKYMRNEIERRSDKYGNSYVKDFSKIQNYRGAMTSWVRVVSNSTNEKYRGFVMYGGNDFVDKYGIRNKIQNTNNATLIGYDKVGQPHYIENSITSEYQKHRPIPGVISVDVDIQREIFRKATIKWKCFSVSQINYMTPYFFAPYNTILLEWGWNTYNPESLLDIQYIGQETKRDENGNITQSGSGILGAYTDGGQIIERGLKLSKGKYDAMIGHITNFDYSFNSSDMSFDCTTEIYSNSKFYYGLSMADTSPENKSNEPLNDKQKKTIKELMTDDVSSYIKKLCTESYTYYSDYSLSRPSTFPTTGENQKYSDIFDAIIWRLSGKNREKKPENHGGLFSLNNYSNIVTKDNVNRFKDSKGFYITIGLFIDILNIIIPNTSNNASINLSECIIGAHPNLISTTDNFLIPNANAPYFTSENLNGFSSISDKQNPPKPNNTEDMLLYNTLNTIQRQNLDEIINWMRYKMVPNEIGQFSFPSKEDKFKGRLKDIYIKYDYALELLKGVRNIKEFLEHLCSSLNNLGKFWNLKIIELRSGVISIRDERLLDIKHTRNSNETWGLKDKDPIIYPFDVYSQNSVIREFTFNVKMSDKVASMVLYDTNASSTKGKENSQNATGQSYVAKFGVAADEILSSINYKDVSGTPPKRDTSIDLFYSTKNGPIKKTSIFSVKVKSDKFFVEEIINGKKTEIDVTEQVKQQKKQDIIKNLKYQNIDESSLWVYSPSPINRKIRRLCLPNTSESLLVQLISDENPLFTNISTMAMPGVTVEFSILGISGFRSFQIFTAKNLPQPYDKGVIFQVRDVKHVISNDGWITNVTATVRPSSAIDGLLGIK